MTQTFSAGIRESMKEAKGKVKYVALGSIQDVCELMTRRAAGVTDGGTVTEGYVPVVSGELINSQEVGINGGVVAQGAVDYAAVIAGMEMGDVIQAVFTAPHARPKEYGVGSQPGWFYVRNAVQQWPTIVAQNAALFKV